MSTPSRAAALQDDEALVYPGAFDVRRVPADHDVTIERIVRVIALDAASLRVVLEESADEVAGLRSALGD